MYVAVLETKGFIVGGDNEPSGVYRRRADGTVVHAGWPNIRANALASVGNALFLAAGNGAFVSYDQGARWRQMTGWRVREVQDIAVDPFDADRLYLATAYGPALSIDGGRTWREGRGITNPRDTFFQKIVPDRAAGERLLAAGEAGVFESSDAGETWSKNAGWPGAPVRALAQSSLKPAEWWAGTWLDGLYHSVDGGRLWTPVPQMSGMTIWAVALSSRTAGVIAAGGYGTGCHLSFDGGMTWAHVGPPDISPHALAFSGERHLWVGTAGQGLYLADLETGDCTLVALAGASVWDILLEGGAHEQ
jgi:photosystem II stability/assembly factor-like uncharacterized protein